jgi:hypothetical protein
MVQTVASDDGRKSRAWEQLFGRISGDRSVAVGSPRAADRLL